MRTWRRRNRTEWTLRRKHVVCHCLGRACTGTSAVLLGLGSFRVLLAFYRSQLVTVYGQCEQSRHLQDEYRKRWVPDGGMILRFVPSLFSEVYVVHEPTDRYLLA